MNEENIKVGDLVRPISVFTATLTERNKDGRWIDMLKVDGCVEYVDTRTVGVVIDTVIDSGGNKNFIVQLMRDRKTVRFTNHNIERLE